MILDIPLRYYLIAFAIIVVVSIIWRLEGGLLTGYVFFVLVETVFIRKPFVGQHFEPQVFWSWRVWDRQKIQILTNVVMFVPVGVISGRLWKWKGLLFAVCLSAVIELLQLITSRGLCEFDDMFHNCYGALLGTVAIILSPWFKEILN